MDPFESESILTGLQKYKGTSYGYMLIIGFFCLLACISFILSVSTRYQLYQPKIHPVCACKELLQEHTPVSAGKTQYRVG